MRHRRPRQTGFSAPARARSSVRLLPRGSGVAALDQGNYDAIAGILGLMAVSYFYAETSGYLGSTIQKIGNRSGIMLLDLLGMRLGVFLSVFVPLLLLGLFVMAQLEP